MTFLQAFCGIYSTNLGCKAESRIKSTDTSRTKHLGIDRLNQQHQSCRGPCVAKHSGHSSANCVLAVISEKQKEHVGLSAQTA
jgi:hypothetical protein